MLDCLERSFNDVHGGVRQFSGYGLGGLATNNESFEHRGNHLSSIYEESDQHFAKKLAGSSPFSFPIKRLYNICNLYENVWTTAKRGSLKNQSRSDAAVDAQQPHGPFPLVDDKATVLSELTKNEILKTRHRVNSSSHPKWALRTIRRRRRKMLIRLKRRSISQEAIRVLQAKLISSKASKG